MVSIKFKNNKLFYIDQTQLPLKEVWKQCKNLDDGYAAIKKLSVRGAPLIGVFAAYCIGVHLKNLPSEKKSFFKSLEKAIKYLKSCRPTAVNLGWALDKIRDTAFKNKEKSLSQIKKAILNEAIAIHKEDVRLCQDMATHGLKLIKGGDRILTHCNTGFLATSGEGTALAVIYKAAKVYKNIKVYADETRPLLQGSRLTAWELMKKKVPSAIICDSMAAPLMSHKGVDKIFVGADRIAANGDVANKIGTYNLAVIAKHHKVPFYVVAPFSSFDLSLSSGKHIPIEQRQWDEVKKVVNKVHIAPKSAKAHNPAFDVTPNKLITAIVSDRGIIYPPFGRNIKKIIG